MSARRVLCAIGRLRLATARYARRGMVREARACQRMALQLTIGIGLRRYQH